MNHLGFGWSDMSENKHFVCQVVLLLHTVMHQMGEYAECIQLANLIVSEQHKLYKVSSAIKHY
jgi:hypothetical protein